MDDFEKFARSFPNLDPAEYGVLGKDAVCQQMLERCWDEKPSNSLRQLINTQAVWEKALMYGGHDFWARKCLSHNDARALKCVLDLSAPQHIAPKNVEHLYGLACLEDRKACIFLLMERLLHLYGATPTGCSPEYPWEAVASKAQIANTANAMPIEKMRHATNAVLPLLFRTRHMEEIPRLIEVVKKMQGGWSEVFHHEAIVLVTKDPSLPWKEKVALLSSWDALGWSINATPMGRHILFWPPPERWQASHMHDLLDMGMQPDVVLDSEIFKKGRTSTLQDMLANHGDEGYQKTGELLRATWLKRQLQAEVGESAARTDAPMKKI